MRFNQPSFDKLSNKEWLVTNGLGGYASSSLSGANTRRYHGLLVSAMNPPTERTVLVSKVEETLLTQDGPTELSSNQYPGVIHPQGFEFLVEFERMPIPAFRYKVKGYELLKRIFMPYGSNTTVIQYENCSSTTLQLVLRPLFVHRDYHSLFRENTDSVFRTEMKSTDVLAVHGYDHTPPLYVSFAHGTFQEGRCWYKNFEYHKEQYRGLDFQEDSYSLGTIHFALGAGQKVHLLFSLDESMCIADPSVLLNEELMRIQHYRALSLEYQHRDLGPVLQQFMADLACAADQFIVRRRSSNGHTILAGYHWFTDWGRDTMIAMRGLVIARGKKEVAESILRTFVQYLDRGMFPNRFPDHGEAPEYNTIDATLWLFVVLHEYAEAFKDKAFLAEMFPRLKEILEYHIHGTRYNIHMLEEGLLYGGEGISQLTWMDARIGDHVVTPRQGCPVEVNALWYNALMIYGQFSEQLGRENPFEGLAEKVRQSFARFFFNGNYLNDVIIPDEYTDSSIRPNQIYAISLPYSILNKAESRKVLKVIGQKLLTPLGLRSLDPDHADFAAVYGGDQWHRDTSYHQGTVWLYLIGEYMLAYLRINGFTPAACKHVEGMIGPLMDHFYNEDCIHGISEIFDGAHPSAGRGCVQQAWSAGMILKVLTQLRSTSVKQKQIASYQTIQVT